MDALGYRKKIGIVVPSTNTVAGPESEALRPPGVTNHVARLTIQDRPIQSSNAPMSRTVSSRLKPLSRVRKVFPLPDEPRTFG